MANKKQTKALGTMTNPTPVQEYKNKYTMDLTTGTVMPKAVGSNQTMASLEVRRLADGMAEVYIPALANGTRCDIWGDQRVPNQDQNFFDLSYYPRYRNDGKLDMERALYWWVHDPVLFKSIRFLCQLANSRVKFSSKSEDAKNLVEFWFDQAMPASFRKGWFLEFFRSGMVPVIKTLVPYVPRDYKLDKIPQPGPTDNIDDTSVNEVERVQAVASKTEEVVKDNEQRLQEYKTAVNQVEQARAMYEQKLCSTERLAIHEQALALKQYEWLKGNIAGAYTLLNPMFVDIEGPAEMQWMREPYLQIGGELQTAIRNPTPLQAAMLTRLPAEFVSQIKAGKTKVWLSPNICNVTFGDKQDYDRYPTPIAKHAFAALEMKAELMAMQQATVRSLKNRILLIKVGSDAFPVTDPEVLKKVAQIFNAMGRTGHFVWSHAIEMEWVEPLNDVLSDEKIYSHWNNEIRSVTGVNPIFTGTSESSASIGNSLMNFKGVEEEVGEAQEAFLEFLTKEIKMLRTALSISADVDVSFDKLNMKDENQFMSTLMQMVMNGLLDPETALESMGFHFPEVKQRMEKMLKDRKKGLFMPTPSANNLGPDGKPLPDGKTDPKTGKPLPGGGQSKPGGKGGQQTGGRPKNQTGPKNQQKKGKSQPKKSITLTLKAVGEEVYGIVSDDLNDEETAQTCAIFNVDPDHILTTAEWTEQFPDEDMIQAWPELGSFEVMQASAVALKLIKDIENGYEKHIAKWKDEAKADGQKRGPYVTNEVRASSVQYATKDVLLQYLKKETGFDDIPDELKPAWDKHMEASKAMLKGHIEGMADEHVQAQAWAMCTARLKKTM